ncbi:MAG TPA: hypothetical protein PLP17_05935, partial [Oligoflexia bacterium]|nr:hypothetical protein [Oligoflexia bacterium]
MKFFSIRAFFAAMSLIYIFADYVPAHAATTCLFIKKSTAWTLTNDCTTDETIVIPNGVALFGGGYTITAIDPPGSNFKGPVLLAAPGTRNVTINKTRLVANLQDVCNSDPDKVVGILFDNAPGTVADSFVS